MLSRTDLHFFDLARRAARLSTYSPKPSRQTGAVIIYKGTVIARAANQSKTSPLQQHYNPLRFPSNTSPAYVHAEIAALNTLRYAPIDWSCVSIYVYREGRDGAPLLARPCPSCLAALKERGVKHIYYTQSGGGYCYEECGAA